MAEYVTLLHVNESLCNISTPHDNCIYCKIRRLEGNCPTTVSPSVLVWCDLNWFFSYKSTIIDTVLENQTPVFFFFFLLQVHVFVVNQMVYY